MSATKTPTLTVLRETLKGLTENVTAAVAQVASATVAIGGDLIAAEALFSSNSKLGDFKDWATATTGWTFGRCSAAMRAYTVSQDLPADAGRCSVDTLAMLYRLPTADRVEVYADAVKATGRTGKVPTAQGVKDLLTARGSVGASGPVAGTKKKKNVDTAALVAAFFARDGIAEIIADGLAHAEPVDVFLAGFAVGAAQSNHDETTVSAIADAIREFVNPTESDETETETE
jgi:hypothetical protein